MSTEANKSLILRYYEEVFNRRNVDFLDEVYSSDAVSTMSGAPEPVVGLEAIKEMHVNYLAAFSETQMRVEDILAEGDRVAARISWRMKHTGTFADIPATGNPVSGSSVEIYWIENGRIAELWFAFNNLSFMQQLGALPAV